MGRRSMKISFNLLKMLHALKFIGLNLFFGLLGVFLFTCYIIDMVLQ